MKPTNIWPGSVQLAQDDDLAWLSVNQAAICEAWPARRMHSVRPLKLWPDGRVRVEFVGTFKNSTEARETCERRIKASAPVEERQPLT